MGEIVKQGERDSREICSEATCKVRSQAKSGSTALIASEEFLQMVKSKPLNRGNWAHKALIKEYRLYSTGWTGSFTCPKSS